MDAERRAAAVAVWVGGACALVTTVILNASQPDRDDAERARNLALTALCVLPTLLAAGALAGRSVLLLPAALAATVVGPLLFTLVLLLWVPAVLYLWAFTRSSGYRRPPILPMVIPALLTIPAVFLWSAGLHQTCFTSVDYASCDMAPSSAHMATSAACAGLAALTGWVLARPRARAPACSRALVLARRPAGVTGLAGLSADACADRCHRDPRHQRS